MGGGSWNKESFNMYASSVGREVDAFGTVTTNYTHAQEMFKSRRIDAALNPKGVIRECCDTEEHPSTIPVILALDVTGSMGSAAMEVAKKLNSVMTKLYEKVKDVEFLIMGIGDLAYDDAPIQASQFESDIRIAEQLDKVYFEGGGGGNAYESYTAAWYFALNHTKLDCWNRNQKGIIITMGDEPLNPYLPYRQLQSVTGDNLQGDVRTDELFKEVSEKFDVYHLMVEDKHTCLRRYEDMARETFGKYLDGQHLFKVNLDTLTTTIVDIITNASQNTFCATVGASQTPNETTADEGISW